MPQEGDTMAEPSPTTFKYTCPKLERAKTFVKFFRGDIMRASVQIVRTGGENNLHSHPQTDGFWMVLAGGVRFYGEGDHVLAELGPYEGVHIPRGFAYWFESVGQVPLEILHVAASAVEQAGPDRVDVEALKLSDADKTYVQGADAPPK